MNYIENDFQPLLTSSTNSRNLKKFNEDRSDEWKSGNERALEDKNVYGREKCGCGGINNKGNWIVYTAGNKNKQGKM